MKMKPSDLDLSEPANPDLNLPPRAIVNEKGMLWFDLSSSRLLGLDQNKYIRVAREQGDATAEVLYLVPSKTLVPKFTFRIGRRGLYYCINLKRFFTALDAEPERKMISYSIQSIFYEGKRIWKLQRNTYSTVRH